LIYQEGKAKGARQLACMSAKVSSLFNWASMASKFNLAVIFVPKVFSHCSFSPLDSRFGHELLSRAERKHDKYQTLCLHEEEMITMNEGIFVLTVIALKILEKKITERNGTKSGETLISESQILERILTSGSSEMTRGSI
jgi:hypothetical protein